MWAQTAGSVFCIIMFRVTYLGLLPEARIRVCCWHCLHRNSALMRLMAVETICEMCSASQSRSNRKAQDTYYATHSNRASIVQPALRYATGLPQSCASHLKALCHTAPMESLHGQCTVLAYSWRALHSLRTPPAARNMRSELAAYPLCAASTLASEGVHSRRLST